MRVDAVRDMARLGLPKLSRGPMPKRRTVTLQPAIVGDGTVRRKPEIVKTYKVLDRRAVVLALREGAEIDPSVSAIIRAGLARARIQEGV